MANQQVDPLNDPIIQARALAREQLEAFFQQMPNPIGQVPEKRNVSSDVEAYLNRLRRGA